MSLAADPRVLVRAEGSLGRITLDRPEAINAIDLAMVEAIAAALDRWEADTDVQLVLIDGAGERGLCAGGDVRALHADIVGGHPERADAFFRAEYRLNARIAEYPKPVIAIADGITMGGGVGLACHAAIRIVTEHSRLAMPETRIGFTPDVGGTWLLGRAPGRLGEFLGLTGSTMTAADALEAGFADHLVPADRVEDLREALAFRADPTTPTELVWLFDESPDSGALSGQRGWIDETFDAGTVAEILDRLRAREEPAAAEALSVLETLSPTALAVTLEAVREARETDLRGALEGEYRRVRWFVDSHPDVAEGIRAQLVDKDRSPRWQPATVAELGEDPGAAARDHRPERPLFG